MLKHIQETLNIPEEFINNDDYIKNTILDNYSKINEDIIILKYLDLKNISYSDSESRICLLNFILNYNYYNNLPSDLFKLINNLDHKFIYIIISKIKIPYSHKRFAAFILCQFDTKTAIEILKDIINSEANVIDKFISLSSLNFIIKNTNITIGHKSEVSSRLNNGFSAFAYNDEITAFGTLIIENMISPITENRIDQEIKDLGKIILNGYSDNFWYENGLIFANYNSKKYVLEICSMKKYKINEYFCMVGQFSENLEELVPYIDERLSNDILIGVSNYLNFKNFKGCNELFCNLIIKKHLPKKLKILQSLDSKEIKKNVSKHILETNGIFLLRSQREFLLNNLI